MSAPYYATVEQLQAASDFKTTAYETDRLKRILDSASREIERRLKRHFYPLTETVEFVDPPSVTPRRVSSAGFWLDRDLIAATAITVDGTSETVGDVETYPKHYGPPYSWLGVTGEDISVTGRWGYSEETEAAGALEAAVSDTTGTTVDITDSSVIGIGDLILIDSEQMIVTAKDQLDTTQNLGGNLTADASDDSVDLSDGSVFAVGEIILINSERMLIVDISGNTGTVKRAYDGSTLAAHTSGDDIYAPRRLTVERGAVGTTAATHSDAASIVRNVPPAPIAELCIAEALTAYAQESAGFARTVGSGDNEREAKGAGLADLRKQTSSFKRLRMAAV